MVFSDLFFLFVFLPVFALCYLLATWIDRKKAIPSFSWRNSMLVLFSLIFYAWGEPVYVLLMLASVVVNYFVGRGIAQKGRPFLVLGLVFNLGVLATFKYLSFFCAELLSLGVPVSVPRIALPIGISFYTFQSISYLIDVYRGTTPVQRSFKNLLLYISMFPQLIAGPIVRYGTIAAEITDRHVNSDDLAEGMMRFLRGLGKKVILANQLSEISTQLLTGSGLEHLSTVGSWVGIVAFTFQIYFDFSGYSDMAIGIGRCLGFHFNENLDHPYCCVSITDFWRRWHISLGTFFRDYLYIPLGGNRRHQAFNILVVWMLTGFWHGASWNFVLWGLWYGLWLILERIPPIQRLLKKIPKPVTWFFTMVIVLLGWVLFRNLKPDETLMFLRGMFGGNSYITVDAFSILSPKLIIILAACLFLASPLAEMLLDRVEHMKGTGITVIRSVLALAVLAVCIILLMSDTYNPFIYFRF
jgi:alginate O-acetyltransferase complex protein AlgI